MGGKSLSLNRFLLTGLSKTKISKLNSAIWLDGLFVCAILAANTLIGLKLYIRPGGFWLPPWMFLLLGGLGVISVSLLALHSMSSALTLLVCTSVVANVSISTGTESPLNATIILVAVLTCIWLLRMLVSEKGMRLVPSAMNVPLLGFLLIAVLGWLAAYATSDLRATFPPNAIIVQAGQFAMFALSVAAFFLTANHAFSEKTLTRWTWIILLTGIAAISSDILEIRPHPLPFVKGAMQMWPFVLLFAHLLFNPDLKPGFRLMGWPILGLWGYWVYFTPTLATKGFWVPALIAMGSLLFIRSYKVSLVAGGAVSLLLSMSGAIDAILAGELASRFRPLIWLDVINMTSKDWLLGLGPVNYMYYWPNLGSDSLTLQNAIQDQPLMAQFWGYYIVVPSHNIYVDILAQTGTIGLLIFITFLVLAVRFGWKLSRRFRPGFYKAHILGVLCGFAAMAIGSFWFADWLLPFVYNITINGFRHSVYSWLLLGTLVSIDFFPKDAIDESTN